MKFRQEFIVPEKIEDVWLFFETPLLVAKCIPGIDKASLLEDNLLSVTATQKLGPMSATFDAKVRITEKRDHEKIEFTATGKAIKGAAGHFRTTNSVSLESTDNNTKIIVEGEAALAGVLGTIGQSVISRQAEKVTRKFATNLEAAIAGKGTPQFDSTIKDITIPKESLKSLDTENSYKTQITSAKTRSRDPWVIFAALCGFGTLILSICIFIYLLSTG